MYCEGGSVWGGGGGGGGGGRKKVSSVKLSMRGYEPLKKAVGVGNLCAYQVQQVANV